MGYPWKEAVGDDALSQESVGECIEGGGGAGAVVDWRDPRLEIVNKWRGISLIIMRKTKGCISPA